MFDEGFCLCLSKLLGSLRTTLGGLSLGEISSIHEGPERGEALSEAWLEMIRLSKRSY